MGVVAVHASQDIAFPTLQQLEHETVRGDAVAVLQTLQDGCVDAVVTDPPYPEIDRPYGRLTEAEWMTLMQSTVREVRRVLKPSGSAVFILQPNSEHVGKVRPWLWEFMAWAAREWNQIQDVWWWNFTSPPTVHCQQKYGLMRPSVKACVWLGAPDCFRDQSTIMIPPSESTLTDKRRERTDLTYTPSGLSKRWRRILNTHEDRGGVTPYNLIALPNTNSQNSGGAHGHGAATPEDLCAWWVRYICPKGGLVVDPFSGAGTVGVVCRKLGREYLGIEKMPEYVEIARERIAGVRV